MLGDRGGCTCSQLWERVSRKNRLSQDGMANEGHVGGCKGAGASRKSSSYSLGNGIASRSSMR